MSRRAGDREHGGREEDQPEADRQGDESGEYVENVGRLNVDASQPGEAARDDQGAQSDRRPCSDTSDQTRRDLRRDDDPDTKRQERETGPERAVAKDVLQYLGQEEE